MKHVRIISLFSVVLLLASCQLMTRKHQAGAVAEVNGNYLYYGELNAITMGLNRDDSARVAQQFIRQWATDILVYEKARSSGDKKIEALVEDYRRSLYVHEYETRLVRSRMSKHVEDSVVSRFYDEHRDQFVLRESIVKGMLIIVPNGAPKLDKLRHWMSSPKADNLEEIEKYTYQYATGYELFLDKWTTENQLLMRMPFEINDLQSQLTQRSQIELQDSISTYILQVTDKHLVGERMPLDYAENKIVDILLAQRQVDFLAKEKNKLYDEAVLFKKVKLYDEEN